MIDLYKAIDIFHNRIKNAIIGAIADVGHSFVFWEADEDGEFLETAATAIHKETGKVTAYFEPDHWDELDKAIEIKIPEDYHYTKEIKCPCCEKGSVREYGICDVCGWENDPIQKENPSLKGGANQMSLKEAIYAFKNGKDIE